MTSNVLTIILGGGVGSRLFPLTKHRAKPAVPLAANYRLIDVPVSNALNSDFKNIYVCTQYNSTSLNRHVNNAYSRYIGHDGFVDILAASQTNENKNWFQGTADAIRQYTWLIENENPSHVLILSGDHLYNMDYRPFLSHHIHQGADITIASKQVQKQHATSFGVLDTRGYRVVSFMEKPSPDSLNDFPSMIDISMGVYIFNTKVLLDVLNSYSSHQDFGNQIIPSMIADDFHVVKYNFPGYWSDIGTIKSYYDASMALLHPTPEFDMRELYTKNRMIPPTTTQAATIHSCIIGDGCKIGSSTLSNSIIGVRSYIGDNCTINDSILMGNDKLHEFHCEPSLDNCDFGIGNNVTLQSCIIDKNACIGNKVTLSNETHIHEMTTDMGIHIKDGIIVVEKGAHIPDDYFL